MRRETPFADIVRHLTPFFVSRQVVCGVGPGRHRPGRAQRRLPDQPARRLLRGRGRARDHAEAADHQHPRRAARGRREVPAAARHHRRRQPRRGLDLPQARHDDAGARDDRGRASSSIDLVVDRPVATLHAVSHDPTLQRARDAAVRPQADRRPAADGVRRAGAQVRRGPLTAPTPTPMTADVLERWESVLSRLESDPMSLTPRARLGGQAARSSRATAPATGSTGTSPRLQAIDLQYTDVRPDKGLYNRLPASRPLRAHRHRRRRSTARSPTPPEDTRAYFRGRCLAQLPRRGRGRLLGLGHLRPARAASRCSGCRPSSRCAARRSTSATCSTAADTAEELVRSPHRWLTRVHAGAGAAARVMNDLVRARSSSGAFGPLAARDACPSVLDAVCARHPSSGGSRAAGPPELGDARRAVGHEDVDVAVLRRDLRRRAATSSADWHIWDERRRLAARPAARRRRRHDRPEQLVGAARRVVAVAHGHAASPRPTATTWLSQDATTRVRPPAAASRCGSARRGACTRRREVAAAATRRSSTGRRTSATWSAVLAGARRGGPAPGCGRPWRWPCRAAAGSHRLAALPGEAWPESLRVVVRD